MLRGRERTSRLLHAHREPRLHVTVDELIAAALPGLAGATGAARASFFEGREFEGLGVSALFLLSPSDQDVVPVGRAVADAIRAAGGALAPLRHRSFRGPLLRASPVRVRVQDGGDGACGGGRGRAGGCGWPYGCEWVQGSHPLPHPQTP